MNTGEEELNVHCLQCNRDIIANRRLELCQAMAVDGSPVMGASKYQTLITAGARPAWVGSTSASRFPRFVCARCMVEWIPEMGTPIMQLPDLDLLILDCEFETLPGQNGEQGT